MKVRSGTASNQSDGGMLATSPIEPIPLETSVFAISRKAGPGKTGLETADLQVQWAPNGKNLLILKRDGINGSCVC